jgi:hypothetical protein
MKWRRHDRSRQQTGANEAFASELKAKLPELARELTSSVIGNSDQTRQNNPVVGGVDQNSDDNTETQQLLKALIKHMTDK